MEFRIQPFKWEYHISAGRMNTKGRTLTTTILILDFIFLLSTSVPSTNHTVLQSVVSWCPALWLQHTSRHPPQPVSIWDCAYCQRMTRYPDAPHGEILVERCISAHGWTYCFYTIGHSKPILGFNVQPCINRATLWNAARRELQTLRT